MAETRIKSTFFALLIVYYSYLYVVGSVLVKNTISLNLVKGFASADFGTLDKVTQRGATIVPTGTAKTKIIHPLSAYQLYPFEPLHSVIGSIRYLRGHFVAL